jgi:hypothetical protein
MPVTKKIAGMARPNKNIVFNLFGSNSSPLAANKLTRFGLIPRSLLRGCSFVLMISSLFANASRFLAWQSKPQHKSGWAFQHPITAGCWINFLYISNANTIDAGSAGIASILNPASPNVLYAKIKIACNFQHGYFSEVLVAQPSDAAPAFEAGCQEA